MGIMSTIKRIIAGPAEPAIPVLGRNEPCWCGSSRKYKSCHLAADARRRPAQRPPTRAGVAPAQRGF